MQTANVFKYQRSLALDMIYIIGVLTFQSCIRQSSMDIISIHVGNEQCQQEDYNNNNNVNNDQKIIGILMHVVVYILC